jgi:hypothetical protein
MKIAFTVEPSRKKRLFNGTKTAPRHVERAGEAVRIVFFQAVRREFIFACRLINLKKDSARVENFNKLALKWRSPKSGTRCNVRGMENNEIYGRVEISLVHKGGRRQ